MPESVLNSDTIRRADAILHGSVNYAYLNRLYDALTMYREGATYNEVREKHGMIVAREAEAQVKRRNA